MTAQKRLAEILRYSLLDFAHLTEHEMYTFLFPFWSVQKKKKCSRLRLPASKSEGHTRRETGWGVESKSCDDWKAS